MAEGFGSRDISSEFEAVRSETASEAQVETGAQVAKGNAETDAVIQKLILSGKYDSPAQLKRELEGSTPPLRENEIRRLTGIYDAYTFFQRAEREAGEKLNIAERDIQLTRRALRGLYRDTDDLENSLLLTEPPLATATKETIRTLYSIQEKITANNGKTREEKFKVDQLIELTTDIFRNEFDRDRLEQEIDLVDPELTSEQTEELLSIVDIYNALPTAVKDVFGRGIINDDFQEIQQYINGLDESKLSARAQNNIRENIYGLIGLVTKNNPEQKILDALASEDAQAAVELTTRVRPKSSEQEKRLQELRERGIDLLNEEKIAALIRRLNQDSPNFNAAFSEIENLSTNPDAQIQELAKNLNQLAQELELAQYELSIYTPKFNTDSLLDVQLTIIRSIPERNSTYSQKKQVLLNDAYDREEDAVRASFGSAPLETITARINAIPDTRPEKITKLRNEYQTFLAQKTLAEQPKQNPETEVESNPDIAALRAIEEKILKGKFTAKTILPVLEEVPNGFNAGRLNGIFEIYGANKKDRELIQKNNKVNGQALIYIEKILQREYGAGRDLEDDIGKIPRKLTLDLRTIIRNINESQVEYEQARSEIALLQEGEAEAGAILERIFRPTGRAYSERDLEKDLEISPLISEEAITDLRAALISRNELTQEQRKEVYAALRSESYEDLSGISTDIADSAATSFALDRAISQIIGAGNTDAAKRIVTEYTEILTQRRPQKLAELERVIANEEEQNILVIANVYLQSTPPDFDKVFEKLNSLTPSRESSRSAQESLIEFTERLELASFQEQLAAFPFSATSSLGAKLAIIQTIPRRNQNYLAKIEEFTQEAYKAELDSINLAFTTDTTAETLQRIARLPKSQTPQTLEPLEYFKRFLNNNRYSREDLALVEQAMQDAQTETKQQELAEFKRIRFVNVDKEPRPGYERSEGGADLLSTALDPDTTLEALESRINNTLVLDQDRTRLFEIFETAQNYSENLERLDDKERIAFNVERFAEDILAGSYDSEAALRDRLATRRNDQPSPEQQARLYELFSLYESYSQNRNRIEGEIQSSFTIEDLSDGILEGRYLTRIGLERTLARTNISENERTTLLDLYDVYKEIPRSERDSLGTNIRFGQFNEARNRIETQFSLDKTAIKQIKSLDLLRTINKAEKVFQFTLATNRILRALNNDEYEDALSEISLLKPNNQEETDRVADLAEKAFLVRQKVIAAKVIRAATNSTQYNNAFITLNGLNTTRPQDQQVCITLRSILTDSELSVIRRNEANDSFDATERLAAQQESIAQIPLRSEAYIALARELEGKALEREYDSISAAFFVDTANTILNRIARLPELNGSQVAQKKRLFADYVSFLNDKQGARPIDYEIASKVEVEQILQGAEVEITSENLGINTRAFAYLKANYRQGIGILVETLRADNETNPTMNRIVPKNKASKEAKNLRRSLKEYRTQRTLNPREEAYIRSIDLLSAVNPLLVAAARSDFGTTSAFVRSYIEQRSNRTKETLTDGQYIPIIIGGLGPGGITSMGAVLRKYPELAAQTLGLDSAEQVGGPFGIPQGPAWGLNSASGVGDKEFIPDPLDKPDSETVRGYGDPTRGYVAERREANPDSRDFSINRFASFGPSPEQVAPKKRYVTNEETEITMTLQAAVMFNKIALETKILKVEPAPEDGKPGSRLATLELTENGSTRTIQVRTELCITSSGFGEETYGFDLKNKRAEEVIAYSEDRPGVPLYAPYLKMFKALVDRTKSPEEKQPGQVVVIYGNGDSRRTMEEQLTRLFAESSDAVKNIKKIYVIVTGEDSKRPRYRGRDDVKARGARQSIITEIPGRVGDVGFADQERNTLNVYDANGNRFTDPVTGETIVANHVIPTAGFKPSVDEVFQPYLQGQKLADGVEPITLPGAPDIAVADQIKGEDGLIFVQTSSKPRFNQAKYDALPERTRAALLSVGAENLVAIGVRGADTEAAVNIVLDKLRRKILLAEEEPTSTVTRREIKEIAASDFTIPAAEGLEDARTQDNANPQRTASALLAYSLADIEFAGESRQGSQMTQGVLLRGNFKLGLTLQKNSTGQTFWQARTAEGIDGGAFAAPMPKAVELAVQERLQNQALQAYCFKTLKGKRGPSPKLTLNLAFKNGRIQPAETFVE